jgi:hypothetical protein
MTYFRKIFSDLYYRMTKYFRGVSSKVMGAKKKFSILVQDSLPIDTTIAKC